MSDFPSTADEFYAFRDDRTNRCIATREYQGTGCAVYMAREQAETADGQTMLLVAANLLSRWCRRVTIAVPSTVASASVGAGDLGELVLSQMRDADPFGDFRIVDVECVTSSDVALCLGGRAPRAGGGPTIFITASGWLAGLSLRQALALPRDQADNRLGAIAAACLGVAQVFKIAIGMPAALWLREGTFDLSRLEWSNERRPLSWPTGIDVGKVLMVGAGSVGSAAAYCARIAGLRGSIDILDRDRVKVENFNRSPIFGRATFGLTKADTVAGFLAGSALSATPVPEWWDEFVQRRRRLFFDYDVWLPLANEFGVRHAMQHSVPPLMIHASTTANWGVNHGRHVPGRDDCLADRFPAEVSAHQLTCATGQVEIANVSVDAALPFASMFAGLLIAADLVRAQLPDYPQVPNFALFDWYGPLDTIQAWDRGPRPGCICRDQGRAFHDRFNGKTKYERFFDFA
jgi:hypothetical protein